METLMQLMNMQGRRALITGANGYIGQVMSHALAELGVIQRKGCWVGANVII